MRTEQEIKARVQEILAKTNRMQEKKRSHGWNEEESREHRALLRDGNVLNWVLDTIQKVE